MAEVARHEAAAARLVAQMEQLKRAGETKRAEIIQFSVTTRRSAAEASRRILDALRGI